jgi:type I restriction enzyme S subunit
LETRARGSTFKQISRRDISQLEILLPGSVDEQHRIAAILDKADSIRRKRESALALADEFLRAWFLEMFGDPRRIDNTGMVLADIASIARGRFSPRPRNDPRFYGGDFPFIQTGEISNSDGYLTDYRQTLNEDGTRVSKSFPKGTVFVAIVGATIGATAISGREFWCPDSVIGINSECADYPPEFIEYLLRFWRPVFVARAPETARANINLQTVKPVPIPRASNGEAKKFGELYKKIHAIKYRLKEADNSLFKSLSQRAFRGEL